MLKNQAIERLRQVVASTVHSSYSLNSRVHFLRSFSSDLRQVYIKRDDELSFGISGSKFRKYSSLIPFLLEKGIKRAVLIGGAYSNNVLGLSQLLIENGIRPILLIRKPGNDAIRGNYFFTRLLVPKEDCILIDRDQWSRVEEIANEYIGDGKTVVVPEGASMKESLPGALSLPLDILRNEQELDVEFDHVFVDAGTGLQAVALLLGLAYCKSRAIVHVVLLAQTTAEFEKVLGELMHIFELFIGEEVSAQKKFQLYHPQKGASFGSVTKSVMQDILRFARAEGVLTDPVYSGKLISESKRIISDEGLKGNILLMHSGGGLSLSGFQAQFVLDD
jgi:1-aminocyclopropane-1-carboxylate deaminase/D-cysteine desulfhydrase-like pyridoxal-dependent ACC family enzyme